MFGRKKKKLSFVGFVVIFIYYQQVAKFRMTSFPFQKGDTVILPQFTFPNSNSLQFTVSLANRKFTVSSEGTYCEVFLKDYESK